MFFFLQSLVFFLCFRSLLIKTLVLSIGFFFVLLSTFFTWSFWPFFCVKKRPNRLQKVNFPDFPFCKVLNRKKKDRRATDNEHQSDCPDGCADELRRRAPDSDHHKKNREGQRPVNTGATAPEAALTSCAGERETQTITNKKSQRQRPASTMVTAPTASLTSCVGERKIQSTSKKKGNSSQAPR